jgi:hypothetical protein
MGNREDENRLSPEPTAQPLKHLVARNELNFSSIDLSEPTLDLDTPRFVNVSFGRAVERFNQGERELFLALAAGAAPRSAPRRDRGHDGGVGRGATSAGPVVLVVFAFAAPHA